MWCLDLYTTALLIASLDFAICYIAPNVASAQALRRWLEDGGAYISPKIDVDVVPGMGYGLKATDYIPNNEVLCVIPREYCIHGFGPDAATTIATKLCYERFHAADDNAGNPSHYQPFLDVLPDDVAFMPPMWSEDTMSCITGTSIHTDARNMRNEWELDYFMKVQSEMDHFFPNYHPSPEELSQDRNDEYTDFGFGNGYYPRTLREQWLWARATLQCRAYTFPFKDRTSLRADATAEGVPEADSMTMFFPFIGFANHDDFKFCKLKLGKGVTEPESSLVLKTQHLYSPGDPICISYGDMSFQQKALSFGWIDLAAKDYEAKPANHAKISDGNEPDMDPIFCITPFDIPHSAGGQVELKTTIPEHQEIKMKMASRAAAGTGTTTGQHGRGSGGGGRKMSKLMQSLQQSTGAAGEVEKLVDVYSNALSCTREHSIDLVREDLHQRKIVLEEGMTKLPTLCLDEETCSIEAGLTEEEAHCILSMEHDALNTLLFHLEKMEA